MVLDENDFDCIRCGARVYHAATQCPHCGLELYPEGDDEELPVLPEEPAKGRFSPAAAVFLGGLAVLAVALACYHLLTAFAPATGARNLTALLLAGPLGALAGGYGAAALVKRASRWHGLWPGGVGVLVTLVLWLGQQQVTLAQARLLPSLLVAGGLCLLAGLGGTLLYARLFAVPPDLTLREPGEDSLYLDLLQRTGYDQELLTRLVEYERTHAPTAGRSALLRRAIARWDRDNR